MTKCPVIHLANVTITSGKKYMKKSSKCPPDYAFQRGKESTPKSNLKNNANIHTKSKIDI